ncbi:MAG: alpha-galactosidase, partial [Maribacter sp.]
MKKINFLFVFVIVFSNMACVSKQSDKPFAKGEFKTWAQTPPMGWNSWDCYGPTVEEHEVKANA